MPGSNSSSRARTTLRTAGVVIGVAAGGVAIWLIVVSQTQKATVIGVLVGLWGLLIAAFASYDSRRVAVESAVLAAQAQVQNQAQNQAQASQALSVRERGELASQEQSAQLRQFLHEYQQQLQAIVRHETERVFDERMATLRADVAGLRSDVVEKVNGQLRMERIETTRLIGSDLEALVEQVRKLADPAAPPDRTGMRQPLTVVEPAAVSPARVEPAAVEPPQRRPAPVEAAAEPQPAAGPVAAEAAPAEPVRPDEPARLGSAEDLLASLPRLSPFTDDAEPETVIPPAPRTYVGRRRSDGQFPPPGAAAASEGSGEWPRPVGHHEAMAEPRTSELVSAGRHTGGRRRREDGESNDVLRRLLGAQD